MGTRGCIKYKDESEAHVSLLPPLHASRLLPSLHAPITPLARRAGALLLAGWQSQKLRDELPQPAHASSHQRSAPNITGITHQQGHQNTL